MNTERSAMIVESELYARLAMITGYNKGVVRDVMKALSELVTDELKNGTPVRLGTLGEITTIVCNRPGGFDWQTKQMKPMKITRCIKFKPSRPLRRAVKTEV